MFNPTFSNHLFLLVRLYMTSGRKGASNITLAITWLGQHICLPKKVDQYVTTNGLRFRVKNVSRKTQKTHPCSLGATTGVQLAIATIKNSKTTSVDLQNDLSIKRIPESRRTKNTICPWQLKGPNK